jgi:hypothetical protein
MQGTRRIPNAGLPLFLGLGLGLGLGLHLLLTDVLVQLLL